jgi:parallel beta-helix repeat protein
MSRTFARQNIALLAANNTQVNGITVTNPNTRGTAIWVEGTNPIIRNSTFVNSKREGIFVTGAAAPKIQNNQFMNNDANGISVTGQAKGEIRANVFQKTGFGIAIGGTSTPLVVDNQIRDSRSGVVVTEKARPILQGNTIANNSEYGLVVISEAQPQIGTNDLRGNGRQEQLIARVPQNVSTPSDVAAIPTRPPVVTPNQTQPSVVAQTPLQTQTGQVVNFGCVPQGSGFATIAQRGEASIPQPMITWNRDLGPELTPERRCQTVTQRLNHLVLENGGSLDNLLFTVGPVRNNLVVCLVGDIISGCNDKNLLFTMSRENARNATAVLQSLLAFSVTGSGNPVQESEGQPYASLAPVAKNLAPVKGLWFVSSGRR